MFCSNCGQEVNDQANFCRHCGHDVQVGNDIIDSDTSSVPPSNDSEQEDSKDLMAIFVGKNYDFYHRKWSTMKSNGISRNIAAFFATFFWLGYRKMYKMIFGISLLYLGIDVVLYLFKYEYDPNQFVDPIDRSVGLAVSVMLAMYGNKLYKDHAEKQLREIEHVAVDTEHKEQLIREKGGPSWLGVLAGLLIYIGVYIIPTSFIPYYVKVEDMDTSIMHEAYDDTANHSLIEQIGNDSMDIPYDEATYEQQVIMLLSFYVERTDQFTIGMEALENNSSMLVDTDWLDDFYDDMAYFEEIMESITEINHVPMEHKESHTFLEEFAYVFGDVSLFYLDAVEHRDEPSFTNMLINYEKAEELLGEYVMLLEEELQWKYQ